MKKNIYLKTFMAMMAFAALFHLAPAAPTLPKHVHAHVSPLKPESGNVSIEIDALVTDTFALKIFDAAQLLVNQLAVTGGTTALPVLPEGRYSFELLYKDTVVVERGNFDIHIPKPPKPDTVVVPVPPKHVHAHVLPLKPESLNAFIEVHAPVTDTFSLKIFNAQDSLMNQLTVTGGTTALPVLPEGKYSFLLLIKDTVVVERGRFDIHIPAPPKPDTAVVHIHADIHGTSLNETLTIHVHAAVTDSFTLVIRDSAESVVRTSTVTGGETVLDPLPLGKYSFILLSEGDTVETKRFEIKAPHVHAHVTGEFLNETHVLHVHADTTEAFTLKIYNEADSLLHTITVYGGNNILPALPVEKYSFTLTDKDGNQVEKGRFEIKVRPVHTGIQPNPSNPGEGKIFIDAPATESFTLKIYDASLVVIYSETVSGGIAELPTLPSGIHYFKVINDDGYVVSKGRIMIY